MWLLSISEFVSSPCRPSLSLSGLVCGPFSSTMLKGAVVQGPTWKLHEPTLRPLASPIRGSTTWLVSCQGKKCQGRVQISDMKGQGGKPHDQRYERSGGKPHDQWYARKGKVRLSWGEVLFFLVLPVTRHPGLSTLVTFFTWPVVLALLMPNCLPHLHFWKGSSVQVPFLSWSFGSMGQVRWAFVLQLEVKVLSFLQFWSVVFEKQLRILLETW